MVDGTAAPSCRSARAAIAAACALVGATGCVIVPTTIETYDPSCQVVVRHIELQPVQIAQINRCSNQGCTAMIVAGAATAAATAVVSGSIAVVGNVAYWVERRASCRGPAVAPDAAASGSTLQVVPAPAASPIPVPVPVPVPASAASAPESGSAPASAPG